MGFHLDLTVSQQEMRERLHAVAKHEFRARAAQAERDGADLGALAAHLEDAGLGSARVLRGDVPDIHTVLVAVEELAYGDPGLAWAAVSALQVSLVAGLTGDAAQCEALAAVFDENTGASTSFLAYEDFGRAPSEYETTARREGERWALAGRKTSVAHPASADVSLLVARDTAGELVAFAWTGAASGLSAERDDREVGKLALTAVPSGPVSIDGLVLSDDQRLAAGVELARAVAHARLLTAAVLVGTARASIEFCAGYALERTTWGRPIAEYQGVSFPIVEHFTEIDEIRLLVWDAAATITHADDVAEIERLTGRAVNRASTLGLRATRDGVQLIGVRAITRDLPSERWYRSAGVLAAIDFDPLQIPFGLN